MCPPMLSAGNNSSVCMSTRSKVTIAGAGLALVFALAVLPGWFAPDPVEEMRNTLRECMRSELELREGVLFVKGESTPFEGTMVEVFPGGVRRIAIAIQDGRPHGISRGWYENSQLEVEEHFVHGVSHGLRTRWFANGVRKSEAQIADGKVEGTFTRWHENGQLAVEARMVGGVADGLSKAWHPTGKLKSRVVLKRGEVVEREFFDQQGKPRTLQTSS